MEHAEIIGLLSEDPVAQQLLSSPIPARLAYLATDGTPRAIPIIHHFDGQSFVLATPANAPKVEALQANPAVALTVDTDTHPPKAVLVRGTASISFVDGVVPEFLEANRRRIPAESFEAFEQEVTALFVRMARIEITPTWAKVLDETRPPESHQPHRPEGHG
jgi:hypothetical protein